MKRVRDTAGFTLTELVVVIAIIGIMAAIGIPSMTGIMPRVRLNSNTTTLANEIAVARVRAISKSSEFMMTFHPGNDGRYATWKLDKDPGESTPSWKPLGETTLAGTVLASAGGFKTAETLIISGNGQASVPLGSSAIIELRTPAEAGDHRRRIVVEPTGRVHVEKWTGGGWVGG